MFREIGSEYWKVEIDSNHINKDLFDIGKDIKYLMSGRTAIDYVLQNIKDDKKIVYMPDYCCESMVIPFIDNGYQLKYYHVDLINSNIDINLDEDCSIFFAMNYFGYKESNMDNFIKEFHKRDIIVIEDITHRLFQAKNHSEYSNYLIASLRKWLPIYTGGIAISLNKKFSEDINDYIVDEELIYEKKKAMQLKSEYIKGKNSDKEEYLKLFSSSNDKIKNYRTKKIDNDSLEILKHFKFDDMIKRRIENVKCIENKLKNNKKIKLIYEIQDGDCPLFVPIIINNRNEIRTKLIDNNIYMPVHWPNSLNLKNEIYDKELSLVCDQRYDKNDIEEYINKLIKEVGD